MAAAFILLHISCVTAMLCSRDRTHLAMAFVSGSNTSLTFQPPPPPPRFQTPDWQVQCRSVLTEIYGHLCLTDLAVKTTLIKSGPRPFKLHCSAPWGVLHDDSSTTVRSDLVSDILVETCVSSWLQPRYACTGLRQAAR